VGASEIGLRRLAGQRISSGRLADPAAVVRWLGAVQAQDYGQSLWAVGSRLAAGTAAQVERAIAERQIARTWLMRGTIHFAPPEDVRWLLALVVPRLAQGDARRAAQLGLSERIIARSAQLLGDALAGDRQLSRPEVLSLLESEGIDTSGGRGYHILWRLAQDALICGGPMRGKQQTFALLDDWAPPSQARGVAREEALALLAARFVASRGPVTDHDLARWAGITLADARSGLHAACEPALATRPLAGAEYWMAADEAAAPVPGAGRRKAFLLAGFDEYLLGYKDRAAVLAAEHAAKVVPGANGIFKPIAVVGGRIAGTWRRTLRSGELTIAVHPFAAGDRGLAERLQPEAERYRRFLGLPATCKVVVRCEQRVGILGP
jgi:Winged helix DNA-binding domain